MSLSAKDSLPVCRLAAANSDVVSPATLNVIVSLLLWLVVKSPPVDRPVPAASVIVALLAASAVVCAVPLTLNVPVRLMSPSTSSV